LIETICATFEFSTIVAQHSWRIDPMGPTEELIDEIYRERVCRARRTAVEDKFLAGPQLFAAACRRMADGIRNENPGVDEQRVQELLAQRLALLQRLREPK
jgi:hypothetical protein